MVSVRATCYTSLARNRALGGQTLVPALQVAPPGHLLVGPTGSIDTTDAIVAVDTPLAGTCHDGRPVL
jgi:hypothetical protein